jgi:CHAD domain-containing protein
MAKLHELPADSDTEGMALLTEHIAGRRERHLAHLHRAIARRRKEVCRAIRRYSHSLEAGNVLRGPAAPDILTAKLDNWPGLHAGNLHEFRICAKELRYMLQLVPETDRQRMNALAEVKDLAGDWHDWLELRSLAKEILDSAEDRQILRQMDAITRAKLHAGLNAANHLRRSSLEFPQAA